MIKYFDQFYITDDSDLLFSRYKEIADLLKNAYWAQDRDLNVMQMAITHSLNYAIFEMQSNQVIGYARVVTDYATIYYLCDVFIAKDFRGKGLGKALVDWIVCKEEKLRGINGLLKTTDARTLYEHYGFEECKAICMIKKEESQGE